MIEDPFRRGLGEAVLWLERLQARVEKEMTNKIDNAWNLVMMRAQNQDDVTGEAPASAGGIRVGAADASMSIPDRPTGPPPVHPT